METYVLGIGCDRGTSLQTLSEAVDLALAQLRLQPDQVKQLATIDQKADELGLLALAKKRRWGLVFYSAAQLSQVKVPNPSKVVLKYMGTPSVSEAAALLAGHGAIEDLVLEKLKHKGQDQKHATISIGRIKGE